MGTTGSKKRVDARWIHNPLLDLIVGCGAWSAPLLLLSYSRLADSPNWAIVFYALALFLNYPHYMSTLYRTFHNETEFQKYRLFTVHITGIVLLTAVLSHFRFSILPWIFTLYLTTSPWHYTGQNYGIFMMFARRPGAQISENTRQAIYSAFVLSYAILFLNLHTGPSDRLFLSLGIPESAALVGRIILGAGFVGFSSFGLYTLIRQIGWKASTPPLVLFSTQMLWFLAPGLLMLLKGFSIPQSRYSTGVLAVMHSAQYLWITSYYARRESSSEGGRWRPFAYFAILIVGGAALFVPGPWLASYVFHYDFTASLLIFTALVNLHHFILDGAIWKLRDGRIAALLLNTQERVTSAAQASSTQAGFIWQWMRSRATGPRLMRVATALVILALAALDQARYVLTSHDDLRTLHQAAALNPYDTSLELRIARRYAEAGKTDAAIHSYEEAIAANPADLAPRHAFLKYLVTNQRYGEADAVAKAALAHWPNDPDLLMNRGILAAGLGHSNEAVASWEKVLSIDPSQSYAHLYLATQLDHDQKPDAAIPHYTVFLEQISKATDSQPDPNVVLPALINLAQCHVRVSHPERAVKLYDLARHLAAQTNQPSIQSVASLNEAILISKSDRVSEALQLYQTALKLDRAANDPMAEAADWRAYAVFLTDHRFDTKYAYAAVLQAETLIQNLKKDGAPNPQPVPVRLEKAIGPRAAADVRKNLLPILEQALQLEAK